jgi:hypothetical protein
MSEQTDTITRPAESDNKTAWLGYVVTMGTDPEEANKLTKAELMALYPETPDGGPESNGETPETPAATPARNKAPDTSDVSIDAIRAAVVADPTDPDLGDASEFFAAGAPQRARKPEQAAMDEVAAAAYAKWVAADRPSQWAKMPVVTFYLSEEDLPKYRYLIRRAAKIVEPIEPDTGVREHFGNEFTLREDMAKKIGREDDAGKTVLMWAAIAKRKVSEDDQRRNVVEANQAAREDGTAPERPEE